MKTETLSKTSAALATVTAERDKLRHAYEQLKGQLELLRRRIFLAKAERIDTRQVEFAETKAKLDKLAKEIGDNNDGDAPAEGGAGQGATHGDGGRPASPNKPGGRRNLRDLEMPEERVEILDPTLEGKAERIGFEQSCLLGQPHRPSQDGHQAKSADRGQRRAAGGRRRRGESQRLEAGAYWDRL